MPLDLEKYKPWLKNGFWLVAFAAAFILMQKSMHPGWKILGF